MPSLELVTFNLNAGVNLDNEALITVLHSCIPELSKVEGASGMRFVKNIPEGSQAQLLGLTGGWATREAHTTFLHSGKMGPLQTGLVPFVTMRDALLFDVSALSAAQEELLQGPVVYTTFRVNSSDKEAFEKLVTEKLQGEQVDTVSGWKVNQEAADVEEWVLFGRTSDRSTVEKVIEHSKSATLAVESFSWVGI